MIKVAIEDFLKTFKSSSSQAADGLEDLNLGDGDSDEYDFMDDVDGGNGQHPRAQQHSKVKYMKLLQDVADRKTAQIVIEMDDLEEVGEALV
jgi:DNA replication licensing factor MCM7